jgi:hypothetical protein
MMNAENAALVGATLTVISMARGVAKEFFESRIGKRLLPVLPLLLAMGLALLGFGEAEGLSGTGDKLMLGFFAGLAAGQMFKIGKTSAMGYGLPEKGGSEAPAEGDSGS